MRSVLIYLRPRYYYLMTAKEVQQTLRRLADPVIAEHSRRFFKTGKGEYGEGDQILGIRTPVLRAHLTGFTTLSIDELFSLLASKYHEERWFALQLLVLKYRKALPGEKKDIYSRYLENTKSVNGWDLVDCSAHKIIGPYLEHRSRRPLYRLARSGSIWERRIAIMSTFHFIRHNDFNDTLEISKILLNDNEDLIHKAVGWMLREVGNRNPAVEKRFLKKYYSEMPRTMLRYAIEKFPGNERKLYLHGDI